MATLPAKTAIIGKIPGYNSNIDSGKQFQNELLKGLTFIDLRPMSYIFNEELGKGDKSTLQTFLTSLTSIADNPGLFSQSTKDIKEIFQGVLKRMQTMGLSSNFADVEMIRIIAANDSTFTESLTNSYGEENGVLQMAKSFAENTGASSWGKSLKIAQKGLKSYSHAEMIQMAGATASYGSSAGNALADLMAGAAFGLDMAVPTMWNGSQYTSNLTVFLKLISPTGTQECIRKNILEPIMYLLAAASPITYGGIMYGFPMLWDVQAQGITNFRIGGIGAMSLMRGSFETTFNYLLQPTVIDVRLTIIPLLNDFAVQTDKLDKNIYAQDNRKFLGVVNPADINQGLTNNHVGYPGGVQTKDTIYSIKL